MANVESMKILNCKHCEDVLKCVDRIRYCECGRSRGRELHGGRVEVAGPCRVIAIGWRDYDGAAPGDPPRPWRMLQEPNAEIERIA